MEGKKLTLERHSFCIQYWQLGVRGGLSWKGPLGSIATITVLLAERDNSSECYRLMKNSLKPCNFLCFSFVFANSFGNLFSFLK